MNILVAEDASVNALMLRNILAHDGHRVWIAENGVRALEMLDEQPHVELLVVDVSMPEMDGLALVRELRGREEYGDLPVLFLTSDDGEDTVRAAMALGAAGYILKPILEPSRVMARLNDIMGRCVPVLGSSDGDSFSPGPSARVLRELAHQVGEILEDGALPGADRLGAFRSLLDAAGARRLLDRLGDAGEGNPGLSPVLLRELRALAAELCERGHPVSPAPTE